MAFGFKPAYVNQGHVQGWEYKPHPVEAFTVGETLYVNTSGQYTKASSTTAPTHICMATVPSTDTNEIPAIAIDHEALYETEVGGAVAIGSKYTINSNGDGITTTTSDGTVLVVDKLGKATTASGDHVLVRIP